MSGGIGLRVNFIICDVSCPIIGNSTMEENQCYDIVKPPPHKSWIMSLQQEPSQCSMSQRIIQWDLWLRLTQS
eukprot:4950400-Amphidinium_carterae.1